MTTHIMLDLETWGTKPGCDIRSIGAVVFDPLTGLIEGWDTHSNDSSNPAQTFYIACDNPELSQGTPWHGQKHVPSRKWDSLHRDPRTMQWWSEQTDEAQAAFADSVNLRECLVRLGEWLQSITGRRYAVNSEGQPDDIRLWSHGPQFDISILAAAYDAVGLPVPWHYRAPRDTRTIFDAAGIDDHSAWLKQHPGPMGVPHHALDDAICQARAVCAAYARLR